jgi:hypothetical protein
VEVELLYPKEIVKGPDTRSKKRRRGQKEKRKKEK